MPRKRPRKTTRPKRAQPAKPKAGVELERFTGADLRTWKRQAEDLERYQVELFFHLEGQRALRHEDLCNALRQSAPANIIVERWVRIIDYKYSLQPLSASGSLVHGGRFNIGNDLDPGKYPVFPALYLAADYGTAYAERFGQPPSVSGRLEGHEYALRSPGSFTSVNVNGRLHNLLDLRNAKNLSQFAAIISEFDLPEAWAATLRYIDEEHRLLRNRLTLATVWFLGLLDEIGICACGAPFDLEVTPNFARLIDEANLPWPPPSPVDWPLKDW